MSLASLIGIDKERYDQGNTFLSQDPYLQNFQGRAPITFNTSAPNVDMMYGGNTNIYGAPTNTGGSGGGINFNNFNQKDNLFEIGPNTNMQPNVYDEFGKDGQVYNTSFGQRAKDLAGTVGNYGLRALAAQAGTQGGVMLGSMIPGGGILTALLGAGAGGKFGFDMSGRGPTDPERITANFYGNQGNQPTQYLDPNTGQLVDSEMQGYNISSARGQGIKGTLEDRIAQIDEVLAAREKEEEKTGIYKGLNKMHKNSLYQKRSRMNKELAAMNLNEQQQMDNMAAQERSVLDDYFGGSGAGSDGDRYDGAASAAEYSADPTSFSGSS
jgi:hypothetical protein